MGQLVNQRFAIFNGPELRCNRLSVNIGEAEAHAASGRFVPGQFSEKIRIAFFRFPAAFVDRNIIVPVFVGKLRFDPDRYQVFLCLAAHRVAQLSGTIGPILIEGAAFDVQDMIVIRLRPENNPSRLFERAFGQAGGGIFVGNRCDFNMVRAGFELFCQFCQQRQFGHFVIVAQENRSKSEIIPVGQGGMPTEAGFHQEHPRFGFAFFAVHDQWRFIWQAQLVQRFQPVDPVE